MENEVKIVRFKDGLDVICFFDNLNAEVVDIIEPMMFEVRNMNLVMQQWLPIAMIKENRASVKWEDILCVMEPSEDFKEYFHTTVEKVNDTLDKKKNASTDEEKEYMLEVLSAMDEMDNTKNLKLH
jgi:hypothetical protein